MSGFIGLRHSIYLQSQHCLALVRCQMLQTVLMVFIPSIGAVEAQLIPVGQNPTWPLTRQTAEPLNIGVMAIGLLPTN